MANTLGQTLHTVKKLGEVCRIVNGFFVPQVTASGEGGLLPYIKSADVKQKEIKHAKVALPKAIVDKHNITVLSKGAFLIGLTGVGMGQIATLDTDAIIDPTVCAVVNIWRDYLDNNYLYYFLLSHMALLIGASKNGGRVNSFLLRKLHIALPALPQQKQLAAMIEQQLLAADNQLQQLAANLLALENKKEALLTKTFLEVAAQQGCTKLPLGRIAQLQSGMTPSLSILAYYGDDYPFFRPADLHQGVAMAQSKTKLSARGAKVAKLLKANTILLASAGPLLGKVGITTVAAACNRQMMAILPKEHILPQFLYYQLQTAQMQGLLQQQAVDGILVKSKLVLLECCVLPLAEQLLVVGTLETSLLSIEDAINHCEQQLQLLQAQRAAILTNSF